MTSKKTNLTNNLNISKKLKNRSCGAGNSNYKIKKVRFHDKINDSKRILDKNNEESYNPINIYYDMTYIKQQKLNSTQNLLEKINIIEKAMYRCSNIFKKLINIINPLKSPIKIKSEQDLKEWKFTKYKIHSDLMPNSKGISCDLVILIRFKNENEDIKYEFPEASAVYIDEYTKRPILGILIINYEFEIKTNTQDYMEYLLLHGITHILGFSYNLFSSFPGQLSGTIIIEKEIRTNKEKYKVKTPKVLEFAKKYFKCEHITGVELENSEDTKNPSHWEARILLGEYMNSEPYTPEQAISEFTLSLLEDSGWYKINYFTGGLMRFGKNQGCNFINKDCLTYKSFIYEVNFKNEFCDPSINWVPSCSSGRQSRSYCSTELNEIDPDFQRFGNYRGRSNTDFCFINDYFPSEENLAHYVGNCKKGDGNYGSNILYNDNIKESNSKIPESFGEKYGNNSFCVLSSVIPKAQTNKDIQKYNKYIDVIHSMCYPIFCTEKSLTIQINNQYIVCPRQGGKIELVGEFKGELYCPDYNLICTGTVQCNDMFDCVEKESLAKEDTYEYDYKIQTSQHLPDLLRADILEGYEESQIDGKCPKNCHQCLENKKCIKCRTNYKLIGVNKNDENPILCYDIDIEDLKLYYLDEEDNTYYQCPDNCLNCKNGGICTVCDNIHILNNEKNICEEKVKNCKIYDRNNEDCLLCKENYFLINENRRQCFNILDNKNKYYSENNNSIYFSCYYGVSHCEECLNKTICSKCEDNYFFINEERGICYNIIDKNKYYPEDDNKIYYSCEHNLPYCEECSNKNECTKCKEGYFFINEDRTKCYNIIDENKYYPENNETIYYSCERNLPNCEECLNKYECTKCKNNYFFINEDRTQCFNEIDEKKYYPEKGGKIYYSCSYSMNNCIECENKSKCLLCEENYYLSGKNSLCFPISTVSFEKCRIVQSIIKEENKIFNNNTYLKMLINSYINDYKDMNYIIKHYTNKDNNYTITIFRASICTKLLINEGFFYLDTNQILKKVNLDFLYNNDNYIHCFVTYGLQNYFLLYNTEINSFLNLSYLYEDLSYNISNNFTYELNNLLGKEISYVLNENNINIFNSKENIFNNICYNFTIQGIDLPYKYRLNKLYLGDIVSEVICTYDKCKVNSLFINNFTGNCECNINEEISYLLNQPENIFLEIYQNSSEISNSFKIFSCFNKNYEILSNIGFRISLSFLIIHIISIVIYFIFMNKAYGFNRLSNPVRRKVLVIEDDLEDEGNNENENSEKEDKISFSDYSNYDEEKNIQDKDIVYDTINNDLNNIKLEENKELEESNKLNKDKNNFKKIKNEMEINTDKNNEKNTIDLLIRKNDFCKEETKENYSNRDIFSEGKNKRSIKNNKIKNELKSSENNELIDNKENNLKEEYFDKNNSIIKINRIKKKNLRNIIYANPNNIKGEKEEEEKNNINKNEEINISPKKNENNIIYQNSKNEEKKNNSSNQSQTYGKINMSFNTNMPEDNKGKEILTDREFEKYYDKNFKNLHKEINDRFSYKNKNNNINYNNDLSDSKNNDEYKQNKKFLILFNNEEENTSKIELNTSVVNYLSFNEVKNSDKRTFFKLFWNILSLKQQMINIFSFIKYLKITNSYIPIAIKLNKFCFMIIINLFINSMCLSQNYFFNKYEYFNRKYNINDKEKKIKANEIIKYAMKKGFGNAMITFIICLLVYYLIEYVLFNYRRKINNLSLEENINISKINTEIIKLMKYIKKRIFIYICLSSILYIICIIYLISFSFVYQGGTLDAISISIITFIFLQIFPIISSLLICSLRYFSIKKEYRILYEFSQLLFS